jgi:NDP-sugar pyrophosphorylase family protein
MTAAEIPVAILAGGLATRLRPVTATVPKLLLEVAGEPFFSHQLRLLKTHGLTRIVLCVGHLGEQICSQYGDGSQWGMKLQYSFDGPTLLGTGGALRQALPLLGEAFYVLYGDSYLPMDYLAAGRAFLSSGRAGLMTVYENQGRYDASNIWLEDGQIRLYDKKNRRPEMRHIDYGLGILRADALADWPAGVAFDLADVYRQLLARRELAAYEVFARFYEIGSPAGWQELDQWLKNRPPLPT